MKILDATLTTLFNLLRRSSILIFCLILINGIKTKAQETVRSGTISTGTYYGLSPALKELPPLNAEEKLALRMKDKDRDYEEHEDVDKTRRYPNAANALPKGTDPVWQNSHMRSGSISQISNFEGGWTSAYPPDANGDIGKDYYFQTINLTYEIFDKSGNSVVGPFPLNTMFGNVSGADCNSGDPIVLYDEQAERWLVAEFSVCDPTNYRMLFAISQTSDPTGRWHQYSFPMNGFPDYEKIGVWRDGYYMATNTLTGDDIYVLERDKMLLGQSAQCISFDNPNRPNGNGFMIAPPVDNDGTFAPANSPGIFLCFNDDAWAQGSSDQLWMFELDVDWGTPANSTFTRTSQLNVEAFDSDFGSTNANIVQPGNDSHIHHLDAVCEVLMNKPQYRNFGTHQSIVCCHSVKVGANNHAGIRWYELRNSGSGWSIRQQGTYAPDTHSRWLGSISMNANEEIALGYSITSPTLYPGIRVCGQSAAEHASASGTLDITESTFYSGGSSQLNVTRWGDYASMSVDPKNDETFWFTTQYVNGYRYTKIAAFQVGSEELLADFYADNQKIKNNTSVSFTDVSTGNPTSWSWSVSPSTGVSYANGSTSTSQNPEILFAQSGSYTISLTVGKSGSNNTLNRSAYITVEDCKINTFPYYEDFEQHTGLPMCINEENVSGSLVWQHRKGNRGSNPANAHEGSFNALFKKNYDESAGVRKLVLPEFDLSGQSSAYLNFWHTQDVWLGDQDQLKIYYKTSAAGSWTLLQTFSDVVSEWKQETLSLPSLSSTYFIAFEGHALGGYGICIDDINVIGSSGGSAPVAEFSSNVSQATTNDIVQLLDQSENFPTSWSWSINPATVTYKNGTSSSSQNPQLTFDAVGTYTISLTATNSSGNDTESKSNHITVVNIYNLPWEDDFETDKGWTLTGEFERGVPQGKGGSRGNPDPSSAASGSNVLGSDISGLGTLPGDYEANLGNAAYTAESPLFDCSAFQNVTVSLKRWLNVESYDVAKIEGSTNEGASWSELWASPSGWGASNTTDNAWSDINLDVSWMASNESKFKIRFTIGSTDYSDQFSGWNIDDFSIYGTLNYCDAMGMPDQGYIKQVDIGSIHKSSGSSGYSIFTTILTTLYQGQEDVGITITNGKSETTDDLAAWVDWNQDGDFTDAGEQIICSVDAGGQGTFTFDVPTGATIGETILRIRVKNAGSDCGQPCGDTPKGEVEDYKLKIVAPTSCPPPFLNPISNNFGNSVRLNWTENGSATQWDIELREGTETFTGIPTQSNISSNPYTYTGLSANTWYKYYVRSSCGSGQYSSWEGPAEFNTGAAPITSYPYQESFEVNNPPTGWSTEIVSGDDWNGYWYSHNNTWPVGGGVPDGTYLIYFNGASLNAETVGRYATQWFDLNSMTNTVLSFQMYHDNGNPAKNTEGIKLQVSTDGTSWSDIGTQEARYSSANGWAKHTADLSAYDGEMIQIAFLFHSETGKNIHMDDVRIHNNAPATANWTGGAGTNDWFNTSNWSTSDIPYPVTEVILPAGLSKYPTLDKVGPRCKSIILQSGASGDASLLGQNYLRSEDDVVVQRYVDKGRWNGISAPVSGSTVDNISYNGNPQVWLLEYDESTGNYSYITDTQESLGDMKGWFYWIDLNASAQSLNFEGSFRTSEAGRDNNLQRSASGSSYGWNLVGNPFPSAIDWEAASGWTKTSVNPTIYIHKTNGWASYNATTQTGNNGGSRYIASGQAFYVETTDNGGPYPENASLKMTTAVQVHNGIDYLKENEASKKLIRLSLEFNGKTHETTLQSIQGAQIGFDEDLDARYLTNMDDSYPQIFSFSGDEQFSINSMPLDASSAQIKTHFPDKGQAKIHLKESSGFDFIQIINQSTGTECALHDSIYYFSNNESEEFLLVFGKTNNSDEALIPEPEILISDHSFTLWFPPESAKAQGISVYSSSGQCVYSQSNISHHHTVSLQTSGLYIVRINYGENFSYHKILIP